MSHTPGDDITDFVLLHLAMHQSPDMDDDRPEGEALAEAYDRARKDVTALAVADPALCLALLADLAGHFAVTLAQQAGRRAVEKVVEDWAGRGWAPRVHRSGAITPSLIECGTPPVPVVAPLDPRRVAGDTPPF